MSQQIRELSWSEMSAELDARNYKRCIEADGTLVHVCRIKPLSHKDASFRLKRIAMAKAAITHKI